jgi:uncharacterized protein (DUF58 family)
MPVAQKTSQEDVFRLTRKGEVQAAALPPLLVQAEKIAASVILGVHGRRAAGPGESFWQYRPYSFGDSTQRVDWHRSAKGGGVFIRENEWESANTLWLWANTGPRMDFKSHLANTTKADRARLLAAAMASLAVRGHERVGALGSPRQAQHGRASLVKVAEWLAGKRDEQLPKAQALQRRAAVVLVSDFLEPIEQLRPHLAQLAEAGLKGHLVQIADPAEETLPYDGRVEFLGLDKPTSYLSQRTENLRTAYVAAYNAHRDSLRTLAQSLDFSFIVHRTSEAPTPCLMALHARVSGTRQVSVKASA